MLDWNLKNPTNDLRSHGQNGIKYRNKALTITKLTKLLKLTFDAVYRAQTFRSWRIVNRIKIDKRILTENVLKLKK